VVLAALLRGGKCRAAFTSGQAAGSTSVDLINPPLLFAMRRILGFLTDGMFNRCTETLIGTQADQKSYARKYQQGWIDEVADTFTRHLERDDNRLQKGRDNDCCNEPRETLARLAGLTHLAFAYHFFLNY
jgi:hypothetical protein